MREMDHSTFRVLFLHPTDGDPADLTTYRLLTDLGHDVHTATHTEDAEEALRHHPADLLIIDEPHPAALAWLEQVSSHLLPRHLVVYTPAPIDALDRLRHQHPRLHVFLRPLHVHGLLALLRQMGRELELTA